MAKGKAKAKPKGLAMLAPTSLAPLPGGTFVPHVEWYGQTRDAIHTIKQRHVFGPSICSESALPLRGEGPTQVAGFQSPFGRPQLLDRRPSTRQGWPLKS